ncbi:anaerobic carbon-monoxide dehydrogenase catalytic subunit [Desulfoferrobacter suflitae]|uniref:anaerobic carbon-monoxide dehydrogenase catalytic subunit n=1 Tax=Desulfoferrobacter suflitae TaxID=2865782 RepID=UPI002164E44E|nr:anaerobic carbon-monoxide dehydrogenase catalytic subunit [Desulfoferrobacter suflitae]MCK8601387.1 anaerobic carbon-monoxide dehydrogenase catalytic subunit [Desulfoferrobacter suflitae]
MNDLFANRTMTRDGQLLLEKAQRDRIETVWDRFENQLPQCGYCEMGLSCRICVMGPCRIDPFGEGPQKGVCGADADIIVARNLGRMIAAGAASHSDHGRDLVDVLQEVAEGKATGYQIRDVEKLKRVAAEYGIVADGKDPAEIAGELAYAMQEDYGTRRKSLTLLQRAPAKRRAIWDKLNITPRGIDRETSEMMHRTHMGVDNNWQTLLLHGLRNALSDGWGGSMIATEVSDILFGTPQPAATMVNVGVLKADHVNIIVHGHNPVVSEMVLHACQSEDLLQLARENGAAGINLAGVCCTGNELLMRNGIPMAGNHLTTELVLTTGAVDMMIVDYQCIMPSLGSVAACYHTKMISTSDKARFPGMQHREFHPENAAEKAREVVKEAIENFADRGEVYIPVEPVKAIGGFSVETIVDALGGTPQPLIDALKAGTIRGAVGIVGCNNPRIRQDFGHVTLTQKLIENDILVVDTGCAAVATSKAGLKLAEAAQMAGPGLREICGALGIPPVLHMGSCVDNVRILVLASALANALGTDICDLPIAGAAPEWYSEKAVAIGAYFVASGVYTVLGPMPPITGSMNVVKLLTEGLKDEVGATFHVEPDPEKAALAMRRHIEGKRAKLGLPSLKV